MRLTFEKQLFTAEGEDRGTIIAVHGFGGSSEQSWVKPGWVKNLNAAGFSVCTISLPLHASEGAEDPGANLLKSYVAELSDLLSQLPQPIAGLGYSFGARVMWELMSVPASPLKCGVLVGFGATNHMQVAAQEISGREQQTTEPEKLFDRVLENSTVPLRDLQRFAELTSDDFEPSRSVVNAPVLLIKGELDALAQDSQRIADAVEASHQTAETVEISNRDHISVLTSGKARSTAVKFFQRHMQ